MILYLTFRPQNYNLFRISHLKECKNSKLPYVFKSYYNLHMEIIPKVVTLVKVFAPHTQGMERTPDTDNLAAKHAARLSVCRFTLRQFYLCASRHIVWIDKRVHADDSLHRILGAIHTQSNARECLTFLHHISVRS